MLRYLNHNIKQVLVDSDLEVENINSQTTDIHRYVPLYAINTFNIVTIEEGNFKKVYLSYPNFQSFNNYMTLDSSGKSYIKFLATFKGERQGHTYNHWGLTRFFHTDNEKEEKIFSSSLGVIFLNGDNKTLLQIVFKASFLEEVILKNNQYSYEEILQAIQNTSANKVYTLLISEDLYKPNLKNFCRRITKEIIQPLQEDYKVDTILVHSDIDDYIASEKIDEFLKGLNIVQRDNILNNILNFDER